MGGETATRRRRQRRRPPRQGAGDEKLPYPLAGINRQALTDFIGTLWDMKK